MNPPRPFSETENPDVVFESHAHWAVGHVDGFSIRVYRDGEITEAFRTYHGLMEQLDGYPVLDEADYSSREYEAALENIEDAAWRIKSTYDLTDGWEVEAYEWLSSHRPGAVENKDDRGAYPSERDLLDAFNLAPGRLGDEGARPPSATDQVPGDVPELSGEVLVDKQNVHFQPVFCARCQAMCPN